MKTIIYVILTTFLSLNILEAQQGSIPMTPKKELGLKPVKVLVPDKFKGIISENLTVNLPEGYKAQIFYTGGLQKPRFFSWSPDSILHLVDMNSGKIIALPDLNKDKIADTAIVVAENVNAHSIEFYEGDIYTALTDRVLKLSDENKDGIYEKRTVFISDVGGPGGPGGHITRTIVIDKINKKIYLSIGSKCNVCKEEKVVENQEPRRAVIEQYNIDGTGRRIFAKGVRNAVGMTLHPVTNQLWANNNGSDWQGNDIPPEWIDIVRDGGFYGYPIAHSYQMYFSNYNINSDYKSLLPITPYDSSLVRSMIMPAALVQAHSAPMGMKFSNSSFEKEFQNGAFVVFRGSWNRSPATGYKVVFLGFDNDYDTTANYVADFLTGFLTDSISGANWARPVGLELDSRGNLYVGSDANTTFVMIVYKDSPNSIEVNQNLIQSDIEIFPNPASDYVSIKFQNQILKVNNDISLSIYDLLWKNIMFKKISIDKQEVNLDLSYLPNGLYQLILKSEEKVFNKPIIILR
ncbi:MAG: PQQ-dependent sugar dehydrogenase [Candidatus Kapabacteria bacterium]|nr:PQQ-dependent sugar dehydrogenase [Candidatus Kapabacteria bacterium]